MPYMRLIITILLFSLVLFSCDKDVTPVQLNHDGYKIYLSDEYQINKVQYYTSDTLSFTQDFTYDAQVVSIKQNNEYGELRFESMYYLNGENLAERSITSYYSDAKLSEKHTYTYTYDASGYLVLSSLMSEVVGSDSDNYEIVFENEIENGNKKEMNINGDCSNYYSYNEIELKIDVVTFLGDFNGKRNLNLLEQYQSGCHTVPSTSPPQYNYKYTLDAQGLVTERFETKRLSYHSSEPEPTYEKTLTTFEYIFQ